MPKRSFDNAKIAEQKRKALLIPLGILAAVLVLVMLLSGGCKDNNTPPRPKNARELQLLQDSLATSTATDESADETPSSEETEKEAAEPTSEATENATEASTTEATEPEPTGLEARVELPFEDLPYTSPDGTFVVLEDAYGPQRQDYTELIDWIRAMQAPITTDKTGPFEVYVFLDEQITAIYDVSEPGKRQLVRAFPVSSGEHPGNTPLGPTQIGVKHEVGLMFDGSWGLYCSQLNGNVLLHSVPSYGEDGYVGVYPEYMNKLGTACSHGCVRLMANASRFIYDYVPTGSHAYVLQNADDFPEIPEDLEALKIPEEGPFWDPTNPNPENPYLQDPELLLEANR